MKLNYPALGAYIGAIMLVIGIGIIMNAEMGLKPENYDMKKVNTGRVVGIVGLVVIIISIIKVGKTA